MCNRLQQEELILLLVPVGAYAFENAGSVMERVGHEPEPAVVIAGKLTFVEDPDVRMSRLRRGSLVFRFHTHADKCIRKRLTLPRQTTELIWIRREPLWDHRRPATGAPDSGRDANS